MRKLVHLLDTRKGGKGVTYKIHNPNTVASFDDPQAAYNDVVKRGPGHTVGRWINNRVHTGSWDHTGEPRDKEYNA